MIKIAKYINGHSWWLLPFFTFLAGISAKFGAYVFSPQIAQAHPIRLALLAPIIDHLDLALVIAVIGALIVGATNKMLAPTIKKLETKITEQEKQLEIVSSNVKSLFDGYLLHLSKKFDFGKTGANNERITLYIHEAKNKSFVPCGRYSPNPKFNQPGRTSYPDDQGCIGQAWQHEWHFRAGSADQKKDFHTAEYGIGKGIAKALKMNSTCYAAARLSDASSKYCGVLVVESTQQNRFNEESVKKTLMDEREYLCELIQNLRSHIPSPLSAAAEGF